RFDSGGIGRTVRTGVPKRLGALPRAGADVGCAAEHEEEVGEAVQVADDLGCAVVVDGDGAALGAAAYGAAHVQLCGGGCAAGDDERAEGLEFGVDLVERVLEPLGVRGIDAQAPALGVP